jgi:hypothetical protein
MKSEMKLIRLNLSSGEGNQFHIDVEGGQGERSTLPFFAEDSLGLYTIIQIIDSDNLENLLTKEDPSTKKRFLLSEEKHRLMIEEKIINETDNLSTLEHRSIVKKIGEKIFDSLFYGETQKKLDLEIHHEFLHIQICYEYEEPKKSQISLYPWHLALFNDEIRNKACFSYLIKHNQPSSNLEVKRKVKLVLIASDASENPDNGEISAKNFRDAISTSIKPYTTNKTLDFSDVYQVGEDKQYLDKLRRYINQNCNSNDINLSLVINFYGHGIFKKFCTTSYCSHPKCDVIEEICSECKKELGSPQGYLLFLKQNSNGVEYVSSEEFTNIVSLCKPKPVLAVITACHSGRSYGSQTVYTGIAQRLISIGVFAVVAFPFRISDESASNFARNFYQYLFQPNSSIFDAFRAGFNACQNEWYRPILFLREEVNDGKLFNLTTSEGYEPIKGHEPIIRPKTPSFRISDIDRNKLSNICNLISPSEHRKIIDAYAYSLVFSKEINNTILIFRELGIKNKNNRKNYKNQITGCQRTFNLIPKMQPIPDCFTNVAHNGGINIDEYIKAYEEIENFFSQELVRLEEESSYNLSHHQSMARVTNLEKMTSKLEDFWESLCSDQFTIRLATVKSNLESIIEHITES